jgi:hypothetical protein
VCIVMAYEAIHDLLIHQRGGCSGLKKRGGILASRILRLNAK